MWQSPVRTPPPPPPPPPAKEPIPSPLTGLFPKLAITSSSLPPKRKVTITWSAPLAFQASQRAAAAPAAALPPPPPTLANSASSIFAIAPGWVARHQTAARRDTTPARVATVAAAPSASKWTPPSRGAAVKPASAATVRVELRGNGKVRSPSRESRCLGFHAFEHTSQ